MNCSVRLSKEKINLQELYDEFYKNLDDSTGTVLVHHGKAKFPGKYTPDYKSINLFLKKDDALKLLTEKGVSLYEKYKLNKFLLAHQLGKISKNDTILFLAVEAKDRNSAFDSLRQMLEYVKEEHIIGLEEI